MKGSWDLIVTIAVLVAALSWAWTHWSSVAAPIVLGSALLVALIVLIFEALVPAGPQPTTTRVESGPRRIR